MFSKNHFIETGYEICIEKSSMEDSKPKTSPNELEIAQMIWVNPRCRIDLKGVVVVCGILEQSIAWIEDLM